MSRVEMYTKFACPFCARALAVFRHKGVQVEETDITMGGPARVTMIDRAGGRTSVPQIFINGAHIGGCDDLVALDSAGKLDPLLAA